ncbi:MAG: hypothetical protein DSY76_08005 [Bacteroidetes bacterium]|nr:MAG: hypothetical protein DSY76_08005 [Bacteroidota bacterium]
MSKFTQHAEKRTEDLSKFMVGLINGEKGAQLVKDYNMMTENYIPSDLLGAFDYLFDHNYDIEQIKVASNKLINILYKTLESYPAIDIKEHSFLHYLKVDNDKAVAVLDSMKDDIKKLNKDFSTDLLASIKKGFEALLPFMNHYTLKENVLFPLLEQKWEHSQCVKLMWSFHDDIRNNIKRTIELLNPENFDLKEFNVVSSKVYFNMKTIIFREERVLFPIILETIDEDDLHKMLVNSKEIGYGYINDKDIVVEEASELWADNGIINLSTGQVTTKEMEEIFNHLPVDMTFVDADNTVKFFSSPKHRIFPRTKSIIGRKVQNCHPPESVHVVDQIVEAFRSGKKDEANFWIQMGPKFVLIRYFAVRDADGLFMGTLEVSQEISELRSLEGERRLLDWGDE